MSELIREKAKTKIINWKNERVFIGAFMVIFIILLTALTNKTKFEKVANITLNSIITNFGFLYLLIVLAVGIFCLFLCFSRYGDIRLGPDNSKPEYSNISWFSMLFSAGMGVGLVFFGVEEPLDHYVNQDFNIDNGSKQAISFAFRT